MKVMARLCIFAAKVPKSHQLAQYDIQFFACWVIFHAFVVFCPPLNTAFSIEKGSQKLQNMLGWDI